MTDNTQLTGFDKIAALSAHFFSFIFSPLLVPTYGMILAATLSYMAVLPASTIVKVTLTIFAITCLLPLLAIGLLYKLGKLSDPGLNNQGERTIPFIISAVSYLLAFGYLFMLRAPSWLTMFAGAGLVIVIACCLINLKWKISVHLAAMGGLVGLLVHLMVYGETLRPVLPWITATIICTGLVGTSRLILRRHTLGQVSA
ncbi:MAG: hypothetical protein K2M57_00005, partial [Paramuribaculum sp.]|nr:hypothetical protein [Paramuribaculum sp.]